MSRVVRTDDALVLYPSRVPIVVGAVVAAAGTVTVVLDLSRGTDVSLWAVVASVAFGAAALWLGFTSRAVLEIDGRGIRAPLLSQPETAGWGRVALYRKGVSFAQDSLDVLYWKDRKDPSLGTERGLRIPAYLLPMKVDRLLLEMGRIHADHVRRREAEGRS